MAFLKPTTRKLDVPNEPGQWVEIRRLASLGSLDTNEVNASAARRLTEYGRYLASGIVAWSYPEPITIDVIAGKPDDQGNREGGMDSKMSLWLLRELGKLADGEETEEARLVGSSPSNGA